ncbi:MAG: hypothetical protein KC457_28060, partial [Myxococcales bacterium]|nr:hypothetical protein [Myxococcales bacterium]
MTTTSPESGDEAEGDTGEPAACLEWSMGVGAGPTLLWQHLEPGPSRFRELVVDPQGRAYVTSEGERQLIAFAVDGSERWVWVSDGDLGQGLARFEDRLIVGGTSSIDDGAHPDWLRIADFDGTVLDEHLDPEGKEAFWHVEVGPAGEILVGGRRQTSHPDLRVALYEADLSLRWVHIEGE